MITRLDYHRDQAGAWDVLESAHGSIAWDVGANILQASKVLAQHFDRVLAFEPCRESYAIAAAEAPANVEVLPIAISATNGHVRLTETEHSITTGQLTTGEGLSWGRALRTRRVPCRTLDSLLGTNPVPDFVKIDVEGHELAVIAGGCRLFSEFCPDVLIEVHREANGPEIRRLLSDYLFTELRHGPPVPVGSYTWHNQYWMVGTRG